MPYDPRMLQMARVGIGMMAPEPSPFERNAPQRPKEWWEQPMPAGQSANRPNDPSQSANSPKPPSMLDMMMGLGRMTPQQYNQRIHGSPPGQQQGMAQVSPWAWLGNMGMPGGAGWSGGGKP